MGNLVSLLSVAGLILLSGCETMRQPPARLAEQKPAPPARPDLEKVQKIELRCSSSGGIPGAHSDAHELELSAGGPCRLTVTHGNNYNDLGRTTATYELPAETFEECRRALIEAAFFDMTNSMPEFLFENSASSIRVTCDGKYSHSVSVIHPARSPKGFDEIFTLALKAEERGKLVGKPPSDPPPSDR